MQSSSSHTPLQLPAPEQPSHREFSRRALLRTSGISLGLGLAAVAGSAALGGCTLGTGTPEPDAFIALAQSARAEAEMAGQLSVLLPEQAVALTTIMAERTAHAEALETELARVAGTTTQEPAPSGAASTAPAPPPPTLDGLRGALAGAQRAAADTARADSGYRAGLAGAISASCAVQNEVLLP